MKAERKGAILLVIAAAIFGLNGVVKHYFTAPAGFVVLLRGFGGCLSLLLIILILRRKIDFQAIKRNLPILAISGTALGFNWVTLFLSFEYVGVSTGKLLDYLGPVIVILTSPILFHEKIGWKRGLIMLMSFLGIIMVVGAFSGGLQFAGDHYVLGVVMGLTAAVTSAITLIANKKMKGINSFDRGFVTLFFVGLAVTPYVLLRERAAIAAFQWDALQIALALSFMTIQTGVAYGIFYTGFMLVPIQKASLFTYIDPVVTVFLSALVLNEPMDGFQIVGAVLIILGAVLLEIVH